MNSTTLTAPQEVTEQIMRLAHAMEMRYAAREIPTGDLYRGVGEREWQESRDALRAAVLALAQDVEATGGE